MTFPKVRVLVCGYRQWARNAFTQLLELRNVSRTMNLQNNFTDSDIILAHDVATFEAFTPGGKYGQTWDIIILVGWSWKVPANVVNDMFVIGMHPSDLPKYAGGSPIQNQIIDGLESSVATMFRLTEKFDEGDILLQEPYSLKGSLDDVFGELTRVSTNLMIKAINNHPNHKPISQKSIPGGFSRKRLKPEHSQLTHETMLTKNARQLYDFIRCHADPYPNVFFEDETGRLLFKSVEFIPK